MPKLSLRDTMCVTYGGVLLWEDLLIDWGHVSLQIFLSFYQLEFEEVQWSRSMSKVQVYHFKKPLVFWGVLLSDRLSEEKDVWQKAAHSLALKVCLLVIQLV